MKLYDVTLPLEEDMPSYPGDPPFSLRPVSSISRGDNFNLSQIGLGSHSGTHLDPPSHYIQDGYAVDEIPLQNLIGPCVVLDMRGRRFIDKAALKENLPDATQRVLFMTDSGPQLTQRKFDQNHVYLTEDGARFLVEQGVLLAGIDYLSLEGPGDPAGPVHKILLSAGVAVLEGVHLWEVPPGIYEIFCLPLKVKGGDGAPARVVLRG